MIREKRQTTLPEDVCQAAGLSIRDQVDWRFEDGEIRGRKLAPVALPRRVTARLVKEGGRLMFVSPVPVTEEAIGQAVAEERASR